jgi:hypothetical protein
MGYAIILSSLRATCAIVDDTNFVTSFPVCDISKYSLEMTDDRDTCQAYINPAVPKTEM